MSEAGASLVDMKLGLHVVPKTRVSVWLPVIISFSTLVLSFNWHLPLEIVCKNDLSFF